MRQSASANQKKRNDLIIDRELFNYRKARSVSSLNKQINRWQVENDNIVVCESSNAILVLKFGQKKFIFSLLYLFFLLPYKFKVKYQLKVYN